MRDSESSLFLTRRGLLVLAAGASAATWSRLYASSSEFWKKKPPAEWTSEEIDRLITRSPWAKQVTAESRSWQGGGPGGRGGGPGGRGGGIQFPGGISFPGGGMGGGRGGRGGPGGRGGATQFKGTVRWESAKPILEALKTTLPESLANRYVISVSGFPLNSGRGRESRGERSGESSEPSDEMLDRLKGLTSLQPKGKALAQPGVVQPQLTTGASSLLFGFAKDIVALDRHDAEVTFSTLLGRLTVKAKFNLKEMMYRGELAV
ncbi:MAG: hypothetical protein ABSD27_02370 [Bryobacteraceae bacterium]